MIAFNSANRCGSERQSVELFLGLLFLLEVLFLAGDVGGPEEPGGLDLQRPHGGFVVFDEPLGPGVALFVRFQGRRGPDDGCQGQDEHGYNRKW